jgi:hypothetical protein
MIHTLTDIELVFVRIVTLSKIAGGGSSANKTEKYSIEKIHRYSYMRLCRPNLTFQQYNCKIGKRDPPR